jgi:hypothetical protein
MQSVTDIRARQVFPAVERRLLIDASGNTRIGSGVPAKPSALVETRVIYSGESCGDSGVMPERRI